MTTIGIVSPGAMGAAVGRALRAGGSRVVATVDGRSERTAHLAASLELLPTLDDVVGAADIVLSIVPPRDAVEVAAAIAASANRRAVRPVVADLNAIAPTTMETVAIRLREARLAVVDGSISGPPPHAAGTTIVYLSGSEAGRIASLEPRWLEFRVVGETVGMASAIKMSTASFYKGQAAIFLQALRAAEANRVLEVVLDDLRRHYPELVDDAPRLLQNVAAKSGRFVAEMHEIAATQEQVGLTPDLFTAVATVYLELSRSEAASRSPEQADPEASLEDVLGALSKTAHP